MCAPYLLLEMRRTNSCSVWCDSSMMLLGELANLVLHLHIACGITCHVQGDCELLLAEVSSVLCCAVCDFFLLPIFQVALRDFPHSRFDCNSHAFFKATPSAANAWCCQQVNSFAHRCIVPAFPNHALYGKLGAVAVSLT